VDPEVVRAFTMRAPFRDAQLTLSAGGPISGEWKISGVPAFDPADGRFAGYRGVALREAHTPAAAPPPPQRGPTELLADPDSLRELVHEIKTPLNAIIGFAEIIEGQYLGPADRGYRHRATEIVRQARLLLAAIDDLDFAAKVHSAGGSRERVDLGALVDRQAGELQRLGRDRGVEVELVRSRFNVPARVQAELADRLLHRLVTALVQVATRGERIQLSLELASDGARIAASRPAALRGLAEDELFETIPAGEGRPGAFTLRLVRGLARIAGGDLVSGRDSFALAFPRG
jgi:signal transduction histidine kinase